MVVPTQCKTVCMRFWPGDAFLFELVYFGGPAAGCLLSCDLFLSVEREVAWSVAQLSPPVGGVVQPLSITVKVSK